MDMDLRCRRAVMGDLMDGLRRLTRVCVPCSLPALVPSSYAIEFCRKGLDNTSPHETFFSLLHLTLALFVLGRACAFSSVWDKDAV